MAGECSCHAWLPQLALAVEMGEIEVLNPYMVEAKCKTK
jgi:hypothetical protein